MYKFDFKTEKDISTILEDDTNVLKWLRQEANQFNIYWDYNSNEYRPDFVVEHANFNSTAFNIQNGGKP